MRFWVGGLLSVGLLENVGVVTSQCMMRAWGRPKLVAREMAEGSGTFSGESLVDVQKPS